MNRIDVVELFVIIKALYQNQFHGDDIAVDYWHRLLANLPKGQVFGALQEFVDEGGDFPPNCPQLLRRVTSGNQPRKKHLRLAAEESWREILNDRGHTSDTTGAEALRLMGGWRALGSIPETQIEPWERRRFLELYRDLGERESFLRLADTRSESSQGVVTLLDEGHVHDERQTGSDERREQPDLTQSLHRDRSNAR